MDLDLEAERTRIQVQAKLYTALKASNMNMKQIAEHMSMTENDFSNKFFSDEAEFDIRELAKLCRLLKLEFKLSLV